MADKMAKAKVAFEPVVTMTDDDDPTTAILFVGHARIDHHPKTKAVSTVHVWPTRTTTEDANGTKTTIFDDVFSLDGGETWTNEELKLTGQDATRFVAAIGGEDRFEDWRVYAKRLTMRGEAVTLMMAAAPVPERNLTNVVVSEDAKAKAKAAALAARDAAKAKVA